MYVSESDALKCNKIERWNRKKNANTHCGGEDAAEN